MRLTTALLLSATAVSAQAPAPAQPTPASFEVVSIKPNKSGGLGFTMRYQPGGRFVMVNGTVATLVRSTYPTSQATELIGAPSWLQSNRYDISTKAQGDPTRDEMQVMIRSLLADRFKLAVHYETREQPVYALVRARSDGRLGPDIRRIDVDCDAFTSALRAGRRPDVTKVPANGAPTCAMTGAGGMMLYGGILMTNLAKSISGEAGRVVVDRTGLDGYYELTLRYSGQPMGGPSDDAPSIFTAVQEHLGLKLEPQRIPLDVLVIDSVEQPTPD